MSMMPPSRGSLEQHIETCELAGGIIWKRSQIPSPGIPLVNNGHGWALVNSKLEPLWYDGKVLPIQLFSELISAQDWQPQWLMIR